MADEDPTCELPEKNATSEEIRRLLETARTVAVVGASERPDRDSHRIAAYLKERGYRMIPVNPAASEILGEKAYPDLSSIPEKVDIVDIFRKPDAIAAIVDEAIAAGARAVWMQMGLVHNAAAAKAREAGLDVVMNKCIMVEHRRLGGLPGPSGSSAPSPR